MLSLSVVACDSGVVAGAEWWRWSGRDKGDELEPSRHCGKFCSLAVPRRPWRARGYRSALMEDTKTGSCSFLKQRERDQAEEFEVAAWIGCHWRKHQVGKKFSASLYVIWWRLDRSFLVPLYKTSEHKPKSFEIKRTPPNRNGRLNDILFEMIRILFKETLV